MDTIANMLVTLLNAQRVGKKRVAVPHSHFKENILQLLQQKGIIASWRLQEGPRTKLVVTLAYTADEPLMHGVNRFSTPGQRQYVASHQIPYPRHGSGFIVLSTSRGLMDGSKARREKVGGELICEIW